MMEVCGDDRFEIIEKAKQEIIESTNIETSPEEMAVLDNILFRCWQMGWLDKYGNQPSVDGDLISRQDAVKEIDSFCGEVWTEREADFARGLGTALSIVESLPSASDSRQRGEWVGCTGCEHYDQQQTRLICHECKRYYSDKYKGGEDE